MPSHPRTIVQDGFKGIDNVLKPRQGNLEYLKEADNVDFDKANHMQKRQGFTLLDSGIYHSIWSDGDKAYCVKNSILHSIDANETITSLGEFIGETRVSYDKVDSTVFLISNNTKLKISSTGVVENWGIQIPAGVPTLAVGVGVLSAGIYQITTVYRLASGEESGNHPTPGVIELTSSGGISLSNIPFSPDARVTHVDIYSTDTNGSDFYLVGTVPNGVTTYSIGSVFSGSKLLRTQNLKPPPPGSIVKYSQGHMYIADQNILWYSQPLMYDLFDYRRNYFYFDKPITAVCPVQGGLWVSAGSIFYLAGKDPLRASLTEKEPVEIIPGSEVRIPGAYLFIENTPIGFKWLVHTSRGIFALYNDGLLLNMSEKHVAIPESTTASATFVQSDGINRYIALLKGTEGTQRTAVGDLAVGTIIRNGITIT